MWEVPKLAVQDACLSGVVSSANIDEVVDDLGMSVLATISEDDQGNRKSTPEGMGGSKEHRLGYRPRRLVGGTVALGFHIMEED